MRRRSLRVLRSFMDLTTQAYSTLFISNLLLKTSYTKEKVSFSRWTTTVSNTFYIVDVFAEQKYSGNQLAVFCSSAKLNDSEMQKIANEMHFSETTFIQSDKLENDGYNVRIFTPSTEVPFAGHPTLGTAYIIKKFLSKTQPQYIKLNLKVGQIKVTFEERQDSPDFLWMQQTQPEFKKIYSKPFFQQLLTLQTSDFDPNYPIQEVSTGLPFIIIPLKTLDAVKRARVNQNLYLKLIKKTTAGIIVFSPQTYRKENQLNVRVFVDAFGISEDPATGSGNGCLASYLSKYRYLGTKDINIKVEQGFEINRPSILHLKTESKNKQIDVRVGGQVFLIADGKLCK
jgi:trans-2,3-dihydro-3-hydroxyanthranilate isomerase